MEKFAPGLLSEAAKRQIPVVRNSDQQFFTQLLLASDADEEDGEECKGVRSFPCSSMHIERSGLWCGKGFVNRESMGKQPGSSASRSVLQVGLRMRNSRLLSV